MRILVSFDTGKPHGLGRGGFVVDDATAAYAESLRRAARDTPDEILTVLNVRVHASAGTPGRASLRAGSITGIKEF